MGTSKLLLFIACVTIAFRSYIHDPNELGAIDTTSAPRSLLANSREEKLLENPRKREDFVLAVVVRETNMFLPYC